ncbi:heme-binding protein (plasmid) [Rhodococcus sp. NBC_00297]|nr:heme-binding protein [Rhodococcus sp. NBC_00297]
MNLSLKTASEIIAASRRHAAEYELKPLTVVVYDSGGHLIAAEREDGASIKRYEIASGKAQGALAFGMGSRALMQRAEAQSYFIAAATAATGGSLIPVPGGVLIRDQDSELIGAIGISGDTSDADEAACVAGVHAVGLLAQVD